MKLDRVKVARSQMAGRRQQPVEPPFTTRIEYFFREFLAAGRKGRKKSNCNLGNIFK